MAKKKISKRRSKTVKKAVSKRKSPGNYIDSFVKRFFGWVMVFADFLVHYGDKDFVSQIDLKRIKPAPTHYLGQKGDERITDLVFQCPLKDGRGDMMAVIVFEHMGHSLMYIAIKLLRYISAIWDAEIKEGKKVLSAPYFIVLRTGKKPYRGPKPKIADLLPKDHKGRPLGKAVEIDYDIVDLPAWDFDKLVGGPVLRLALGILKKMGEDDEDGLPEAFLPLLEVTDEEQKVELTKEALDFVDKALKAHNRRLDATMMSKVLKPVFRDKELTMIKSIFDEKEAIGEARGVALGEARGIALGEARGATGKGRSMLLTFLRAKFRKVPKTIENAIGKMTDPVALESLAAIAATCESLDEFAEAIN
jgi:hypothetical protein